MTQCNFLLVIDPILIVGPQAGVQNPLPKTCVASLQVRWNRFPLRCSRMSGEFWGARYDLIAPMVDYLPGLVSENLTGQSQAALVLVCKARAYFQLSQFV